MSPMWWVGVLILFAFAILLDRHQMREYYRDLESRIERLEPDPEKWIAGLKEDGREEG